MAARIVYAQELEHLTNTVSRMGELIELSISKVMNNIHTLDVEVAKEIIASDEQINKLEEEIQKECISLIAKEAPVAKDLRKIVSIMRMIADIERIADHCSDISEYIIYLSEKEPMTPPSEIGQMFLEMKAMVHDTISSFVKFNVERAERVIKRDDIIDNYFHQLKEELCETMEKNPKLLRQCVDYLMIIKYIERMADHSANIARWIPFIVNGELDLQQ